MSTVAGVKVRKDTKETVDLAKTVDALGDIKARIADLEKEEKRLSEILKSSGQAEIDGSLFRATVSDFNRVTLVADLVKKFLTKKELSICEKSTPVTIVRVVARK